MKPLTILITDDHKLVREAWTLVLNQDPRFNIVAECATAEDAIEAAKKWSPDIILLDISLPGLTGIDAVPLIKQVSPVSKIIGVSLHTMPSFVRKMMQQGAFGYITKNASKEEMMEGIIAVYEGKKFICKYMKQEIAEQYAKDDQMSDILISLTQREL